MVFTNDYMIVEEKGWYNSKIIRGRIILLVDINARIGNEVREGIKQKYNERVTNRNGQILTQFWKHNKLHINYTYFPHKEQLWYTFYERRNNSAIQSNHGWTDNSR